MLRVLAFLSVLSALVTIGAGVTYWLLADPASPPRNLAGLEGDPERGAYLARLAGCVTCHTDVAGGGSFLGGGPAIETAYGTFHPPNITSDVNAGIGAWTLEQFAAAVVDGRAPDGRHYYPAFPYTAYRTLTDQDIVDLWAALRTSTPAQTKTPPHSMRFPIAGRYLLGAWKKLAAFTSPVVRDPSKSASWNRGAYIATGPGLCSQCHSPRNLLGAVATGSPLVGGGSGIGPAAGPITAEALRQRGWTAESLANALRTGHRPDGSPFVSPMREVVRASTAHLNDGDIDALVEFLLTGR